MSTPNESSEDLKEAIRKNASGPARVSGDAGSVEQHSIKDLIAADKHLANQQATQSKLRGLRFNRFVPPGTN